MIKYFIKTRIAFRLPQSKSVLQDTSYSRGQLKFHFLNVFVNVMSNNDDSSLKWFVLGGIVTVGVSIGLGYYYKKHKKESVPPVEISSTTPITIVTPPATPPPSPLPPSVSSPTAKPSLEFQLQEKLTPRRKKISMIKMKLDLYMEQKKVRIFKTQMDNDEIQTLVDSLLKSQNLTELGKTLFNVGFCSMHLDLNETSLNTDGLNSLTRILSSSNKKLKKLSVASNSITDIQQLAFALATNTSLTTLELARNEINSEDSLQCLAESLEENTTLKKLDLNSNLIPSSCAVFLSEMLTNNSSLSELSLAFNSLGKSLFLVFSSALVLIFSRR